MFPRALVLCAMLSPPGAALAQSHRAGAPAAVDAPALARALPERLVDRIRKRPEAYIEEATELILNFGADGGIGAEGIATAIRAERARVRAREVERFLRADLDNDGRITVEEFDGLIARTYQGGRGRLKLAQGRADRIGDGAVSAAELAAHVEAEAGRALHEADVARMMALMAFDLDGDGTVVLGEVTSGTGALAALDLTVARKDI